MEGEGEEWGGRGGTESVLSSRATGCFKGPFWPPGWETAAGKREEWSPLGWFPVTSNK